MVCSMKKIVRGPFASVTGRRRALPPPVGRPVHAQATIAQATIA